MKTKFVLTLCATHGMIEYGVWPEYTTLAVFDERPSEIALFDVLSKVVKGSNEVLCKLASGDEVGIGEGEFSITVKEVHYAP